MRGLHVIVSIASGGDIEHLSDQGDLGLGTRFHVINMEVLDNSDSLDAAECLLG